MKDFITAYFQGQYLLCSTKLLSSFTDTYTDFLLEAD